MGKSVKNKLFHTQDLGFAQTWDTLRSSAGMEFHMGFVIGIVCLVAAVILVLWNRGKTHKIMTSINKMLDLAIDGSFIENTFDESRLSSLETRFAHYLSASETSARNVVKEREKIKSLIADISHQTKTPIANLTLYSELLQEEELSESARANAQALYQQSEKLRFLIDSLVKCSCTVRKQATENKR